jgi:hypothetical protein
MWDINDSENKLIVEPKTRQEDSEQGSILPRRWKGMGCQRQAPAALPPEKRPGTHCTWSSVGPKAGLGVCENSHPHRDSIPGLSSP